VFYLLILLIIYKIINCAIYFETRMSFKFCYNYYVSKFVLFL